MSAERYQCATCKKWHEGPEFSYAADVPDLYRDIPEAERKRRAQLTPDTCIIDGKYYFLRGVIEIPIIGRDQMMVLGVWVSQSEASYTKVMAAWDKPEQSSLAPTFGWLCTRLGFYPDTEHLKTMVHQREPGLRPWIELEPTDHPLAVDQREGMTWERACEIDQWVRHPNLRKGRGEFRTA